MGKCISRAHIAVATNIKVNFKYNFIGMQILKPTYKLFSVEHFSQLFDAITFHFILNTQNLLEQHLE
jgi:hypothetical protein